MGVQSRGHAAGLWPRVQLGDPTSVMDVAAVSLALPHFCESDALNARCSSGSTAPLLFALSRAQSSKSSAGGQWAVGGGPAQELVFPELGALSQLDRPVLTSIKSLYSVTYCS